MFSFGGRFQGVVEPGAMTRADARPPIPSPAMSSQGTDTRPDGGHRDKARTVPGWESVLVVWVGEGGGRDMAQAGRDG